jgi:hypothetical protein
VRLTFLQLPVDERRLYIEEAARRRGLSPVVMEKDFWVCWLLGVLFAATFRDDLVFKGGTSLSKVFGVVERFSEDIDLSLSPAFVGFSETMLEDAPSRTRRDALMHDLQGACAEKVHGVIRPEVERITTDVLGPREGGMAWTEFVTDPATDSPVLLFHYPTTQPTGFEYLRRSVKLEFGSLTDQRPATGHPIRPWMAEALGQGFDDWECEVVALEVERTFWEKATILHAEYHRPQDRETPDRFSRHYADTAALASHAVAKAALAQHQMRDRVVAWKSRFFASGWARYDLAKPGTFRVVPPDARVARLRADYSAMADMYLATPLPFDDVIEALASLQEMINSSEA